MAMFSTYLAWSLLNASPHALCLQPSAEGVWAGGEFGVALLDASALRRA
jgi:hypothetical protein